MLILHPYWARRDFNEILAGALDGTDASEDVWPEHRICRKLVIDSRCRLAHGPPHVCQGDGRGALQGDLFGGRPPQGRGGIGAFRIVRTKGQSR